MLMFMRGSQGYGSDGRRCHLVIFPLAAVGRIERRNNSRAPPGIFRARSFLPFPAWTRTNCPAGHRTETTAAKATFTTCEREGDYIAIAIGPNLKSVRK